MLTNFKWKNIFTSLPIEISSSTNKIFEVALLR